MERYGEILLPMLRHLYLGQGEIHVCVCVDVFYLMCSKSSAKIQTSSFCEFGISNNSLVLNGI